MVDNAKAERELLVQLLAPRGFELRQACSGHDALDLLATGYRPDALLLDLSMPGIDGWETLRRLRQMPLHGLRCASVSANALDKGLERALALVWLDAAPAAMPPPIAPAALATALSFPGGAALAALQQSVALGYYQGILNALDEIERDQPDNLAVLHDALDESGYTVLVATRGDAALQRAAQALPDIVLLDALMPGMDGFEVARRLKAMAQTAHTSRSSS
ncbi:integral membrane hybrid sensor histidine kinase/response regulator [Rhodoferax antarcticus ANT.BR]|uniref:Integral membrane hybrid sensor histidine kinase/response regulator n=1 Tax=Rhodoferax antarcticus ANT.BR TaxID=1111071 RepID=A0A1Q8YAW9_9BURK|nr:hypothetical protein RA876_13080 [Rhodoferax antarcticus]OLP05039.1 integral membrane hybrid sensor histidine kinase/response regulator [Rhodoferax antarcticus ANT.BR]